MRDQEPEYPRLTRPTQPVSVSLAFYGTDAVAIKELIAKDPTLGQAARCRVALRIAAEVIWAAREEMARSVEDVLARRTRALFLNSKGCCPHGAASCCIARPRIRQRQNVTARPD